MPRWASRLTLKVTEVRVERVQDITEADAIAEGIDWKRLDNWTTGFFTGLPEAHVHHTAKDAYKALWDSINAKRGFGWEANPMVWVVGFEVRR